MSFIMDLPPDVETRLEAEASRQGVPASTVALRLFTDNLPEPEAAKTPGALAIPRRPLPARKNALSVEEWEAQFDALLARQSKDAPALDPESLRRVNMYEERV